MLKNLQIEHIGNVGLVSPENNNRIERLHGTIKNRIKKQKRHS